MKKILLVFIIYTFTLLQISNVEAYGYLDESDENFIQCISYNNQNDLLATPPVIDATSAIVIDNNSKRILYEKNAHLKRAIASTTKIMTAIVAIENGNLNDTVSISKKAASIGGSTIKLKQNEKLTLKELLYGLLMKSGNDAAIAISEHIGGNVKNFVVMMNDKSIELGLKNTHFDNPHGLDSDNHYSTAYELALISRYALSNSILKKIVNSSSSYISGRDLQNTNEMLALYPGADGVKTGYTSKAGRCLVTSATRDNHQLISVVLNCSSRAKRAKSSKDILDYAFNNYKFYTLLKKEQHVRVIPIAKGLQKQVSLVAQEEVCLPLNKNELKMLSLQTTIPTIIKAPIFSNIEVGKLEYMLDNQVIAEAKLKTANDVEKKQLTDYFSDIFGSWMKVLSI